MQPQMPNHQTHYSELLVLVAVDLMHIKLSHESRLKPFRIRTFEDKITMALNPTLALHTQ